MDLYLLGVGNFEFPEGVFTAELSLHQRNVLDTQLSSVDLNAIPLPQPFKSLSGRRSQEYRLGSLAANLALSGISTRKDIIPGMNKDGVPTWPKGLCGSIAHGQEYSAAAVAETKQFRALGLDVENCLSERLLSVVADRFMTDRERKILRMITNPETGEEMVFTAGISAKECVLKCLHSTGEIAELSQIQILSGRRKSPISLELELGLTDGRHEPFLVSVLQDNYRAYSSTSLR